MENGTSSKDVCDVTYLCEVTKKMLNKLQQLGYITNFDLEYQVTPAMITLHMKDHEAVMSIVESIATTLLDKTQHLSVLNASILEEKSQNAIPKLDKACTSTDTTNEVSEWEKFSPERFVNCVDSPFSPEVNGEDDDDSIIKHDVGSPCDNDYMNIDSENDQGIEYEGMVNTSTHNPYPLFKIMTTAKGKKAYSCTRCSKVLGHKQSIRAHMFREHNYSDVSSNHIFPCSTCHKKFANKQGLIVHSKSHLVEKPFACPTCQRTFAQKITLESHVATQHTRILKYTCSKCSKSFTNQSRLTFHEHLHRKPRFVCEFCGKSFLRMDVLATHQLLHIPLKRYLCVACGKTFPSKKKLKLHELRHDEVTGDAQTSAVKHTCSVCGVSYRNKSSLNLHMKRHLSTTLFSCTKPGCARTFLTREDLVKHSRSHQMIFPCGQCDKRFPYKSSLLEHEKQHQNLTLEEAKPHQCNLCEKRFAHKSRLNSHLKTHQESGDLSCGVCGKLFKRRDVLRRHALNLHGEQATSHCETCGKCFPLHTLEKHVKAVHPDASEARKCHICGRHFKREAYYNSHMKAHRGEYNHQCTVCEKQFMKKSHFLSHMTTHNNIRPHACQRCDKVFKLKKHLVDHVKRVHTSLTSLAIPAEVPAEEMDNVLDLDQLTMLTMLETDPHTLNVLREVEPAIRRILDDDDDQPLLIFNNSHQ